MVIRLAEGSSVTTSALLPFVLCMGQQFCSMHGRRPGLQPAVHAFIEPTGMLSHSAFLVEGCMQCMHGKHDRMNFGTLHCILIACWHAVPMLTSVAEALSTMCLPCVHVMSCPHTSVHAWPGHYTSSPNEHAVLS